MKHNSIRCGILGHAFISGDGNQVAAWRTNPGTLTGKTWPHGMLKQSEDQTIVSLVALLQIIQNKQISESELSKWGVIAGPLFLGRAVLSAAFAHFSKEGAWGVSPHLIPHRFLHSVSGTLSLALGMHGPNFGVGGGASSHVEATTMACMLAGNSQSAGLWLVLSGYDPERLPEHPSPIGGEGKVRESSWHCHSLALALVAADHPQSEHTLMMTLDGVDSPPLNPPLAKGGVEKPMKFMHDLVAALNSPGSCGTALPSGGGRKVVRLVGQSSGTDIQAGQFIFSLARNEPVQLRASHRAA